MWVVNCSSYDVHGATLFGRDKKDVFTVFYAVPGWLYFTFFISYTKCEASSSMLLEWLHSYYRNKIIQQFSYENIVIVYAVGPIIKFFKPR